MKIRLAMMRIALLLSLAGLVFVQSCKDDEDPLPEPTITLQASTVDGVRGTTVTISGSVTAAAGLRSFSADNPAVSISGVTLESLLAQNFSASISLTDLQALGNLSIIFAATDNQDRSVSQTFVINVVAKGNPTIVLKPGTASNASAKRRQSVTITLTITAPEGLDKLIVRDGADNIVAEVGAPSITNPEDFSWEYTLPDGLAPGTPQVLKHTVIDLLGRVTATSADFTVNPLPFDAPTIAFTDIDASVTQEFEVGTTVVKLTLGKDALVGFEKLIVISTTSVSTASTTEEIDLTAFTGDTFEFNLTVDQQLFSENNRTFRLVDEFEAEPTPIFFTYRVIDPLASFSITDEEIGSTAVKMILGNIDQELTLINTNAYALNGPVTVTATGLLSIQQGTNFYAVTGGTLGSASLKIEVGGKIMAQGTSTAPIVFTSDKGLKGETPDYGDWVGLRLDGDATNLNSGVLNYVRIEYGGANSDGGLRLQDLGNETMIDFVQIFKSKDHGIRLRGGNVNVKHIMVTDALKLSMRVDDGATGGHAGKGQFIILNKATGQTNGTDTREVTCRESGAIHWSNVTLIGSGTADPPGGGSSSNDGARMNANAGGYKVVNAIISDYPDDGWRDDTTLPTGFAGTALLAYTTFQRVVGTGCTNGIDNDFCLLRGNAVGFTAAEFNNTIDVMDLNVEQIPGINASSFVPTTVPTTTFNFNMAGYDDMFFDSNAKYAGAIGAIDWTLGWSKNVDGTLRQ